MKKFKTNRKSNIEDYLYLTLPIIIICLLLYKRISVISSLSLVVIIVVVMTIITIISNVFCRNLKKTKYLKSSIDQIDRMSGIEFEELLKAHFQKFGYKVATTPKTGDYGVDLICRKSYVKDGKRVNDYRVVQAKRYKAKIGISVVQQILGGMNYYGCNRGMVITNSFYTKNAWELAKKSNVILWDRNMLIKVFNIEER